MTETQVPPEVSANAALAVIGRPEVAAAKAHLVVGQKVGGAVGQDLSVEEIGMHVPFDRVANDIVPGRDLELRLLDFHGKLFRTRGAGARVDRIEDVRRETALVAAIFHGQFRARQPDFFRETILSGHGSPSGGRTRFLEMFSEAAFEVDDAFHQNRRTISQSVDMLNNKVSCRMCK